MSSSLTTTANGSPNLRLRFDGGTILIEGLSEDDPQGVPGIKFDPRLQLYRAEAIWYRPIIEYLSSHQIGFTDEARDYKKARWSIRVDTEPFPHQIEGLRAWLASDKRGVIVLPTGTGK